MSIKKDITVMLNKALELEQAAYIQYLTHAEVLKGFTAETIAARLRDSAQDEAKHADKLRNLICNYLNAESSMSLASTEYATATEEIININLTKEEETVSFYQEIHQKILDNKDKLGSIYAALEEAVRLILVEEEEHVAELKVLIG